MFEKDLPPQQQLLQELDYYLSQSAVLMYGYAAVVIAIAFIARSLPVGVLAFWLSMCGVYVAARLYSIFVSVAGFDPCAVAVSRADLGCFLRCWNACPFCAGPVCGDMDHFADADGCVGVGAFAFKLVLRLHLYVGGVLRVCLGAEWGR